MSVVERPLSHAARPLLGARGAHGTVDVPIAIAVTLLAAVLRLSLISGYRFHPDEALYATWARMIATGQDVWLATRVVDKPPLFIYTLAALFGTLGASEEIARLPNELASIVSVLLTYAIARELYDRRVAAFAALALVLSPIAILFAPTAFTDPFMLLWLLASAHLALRKCFVWSGLAFGLALATKQDALLALPLLLFQISALRRRRINAAQDANFRLQTEFENPKLFLTGLALPLALVVAWSVLRPQPDFFGASLDHFGGFRPASLEEYVPRAVELLSLAHTLTSDWVLLLALCITPLMLWRERKRADGFLLSAAAYWLVLHWVVGFPTWDRYVLPLAPLACILIARAFVFALDAVRARALQVSASAALLALLVLPARAVLHDQILVGRDFNLHAGVEQVGAYFWQIDTTATILYVHDLSWELDYYTFGRELDRRWMPDVQSLTDDATHMPLAHRYVALASWEGALAELPAALARANLRVETAFVARRADGSAAVYVYLIMPNDLRGVGFASSDFLTLQ